MDILLSNKHTRFVDEYLVDLNATQAAIRAGFSPRSARQIAHRLLTKDDVALVVEQKRRETETRLRIEREDVVRGLLVACRIAQDRGDPNAMISACREIGKMLGYYQVSTRSGRQAQSARNALSGIEAMTDDELIDFTRS